jgi:hypothetical protein
LHQPSAGGCQRHEPSDCISPRRIGCNVEGCYANLFRGETRSLSAAEIVFHLGRAAPTAQALPTKIPSRQIPMMNRALRRSMPRCRAPNAADAATPVPRKSLPPAADQKPAGAMATAPAKFAPSRKHPHSRGTENHASSNVPGQTLKRRSDRRHGCPLKNLAPNPIRYPAF